MIHEVTILAALGAAALIGWTVHQAALRRSQASGSALRRHAEHLELRLGESDAQRTLLETVISAMGEGVLVVGSAGRVLLANPRLRELFAAPAALEGRSLLEAVRHAEIVDAIEAAISEGAVQVREVTIGPAPERQLRLAWRHSRRATNALARSRYSATSPRCDASRRCGATSSPTRRTN